MTSHSKRWMLNNEILTNGYVQQTIQSMCFLSTSDSLDSVKINYFNGENETDL